MALLQGYEYPIDDLQPMHDLLKEWGLECTFQTLLDELIDLQVLTVMKPEHVNELLIEYPIGIKILFSHHLENWQKSLMQNINCTTPTTALLNIPNTKSISQQKATIDNNITLKDILSSSTTGTMIIDYYKNNNKFNDNIRSLLVDNIINFIITNKLSMSVHLADNIGNQIVTMFPSEVKDIYFMRCDINKNPKGKLYAKYYNSMRALKSSGLIPSTSHVKSSARSFNRKHNVNFEPETDINDILHKIKYQTNDIMSELESNWRATTKYRLNNIQNALTTSEILNNWNGYSMPLGYRLVDIDFNILYPDCSNLMASFLQKSKKILGLLNEKIKDCSSRKLFDSIKDDSSISKNGMNTVLFYLLHAVFVPTSKKVTRDHNGKKSQVKHSIKDSQNSFIVFKNSITEVEEFITIRHSEKNSVHPFILIVGTPINPKEIIVSFDSIKYEGFTILSAIDVCFKLFHLFNLEYPSESCIVWLFIQKYFYNLNTNFDKSCHTLGQILSDLSTN